MPGSIPGCRELGPGTSADLRCGRAAVPADACSAVFGSGAAASAVSESFTALRARSAWSGARFPGGPAGCGAAKRASNAARRSSRRVSADGAGSAARLRHICVSKAVRRPSRMAAGGAGPEAEAATRSSRTDKRWLRGCTVPMIAASCSAMVCVAAKASDTDRPSIDKAAGCVSMPFALAILSGQNAGGTPECACCVFKTAGGSLPCVSGMAAQLPGSAREQPPSQPPSTAPPAIPGVWAGVGI